MLNTKLGKAYGGQLFWKIWNRIDIEHLAKVWKFSDSMYNYLQRPNQVLAGRLPPMTLKTCTLGHPKCLKMLTAYWGKTYKGQMVWHFWDLIVIKELPKVWKLSDAMHHLQVLAGKSPKYTLKASTLNIQNTRKYWLPTWGRPMEVSCFGIFEIQSESSSRQRFEN